MGRDKLPRLVEDIAERLKWELAVPASCAEDTVWIAYERLRKAEAERAAEPPG